MNKITATLSLLMVLVSFGLSFATDNFKIGQKTKIIIAYICGVLCIGAMILMLISMRRW